MVAAVRLSPEKTKRKRGLWKTSEALMAPGRCSFPKLLGGLILVLILEILVPILVVLWKVVGQRGLCMTMTIIPSISQKRRRASQRKAVYDHDHHPFPFQKRRTSQDLIWGLFVTKPFPSPAEEESF